MTTPPGRRDGDKIAYTARVGKKFQIKLYDLNTKKSKQFTFGPGSSEQPAWSPDGRFIVYRHRENGKLQIVTKSVNGGKGATVDFC